MNTVRSTLASACMLAGFALMGTSAAIASTHTPASIALMVGACFAFMVAGALAQ